MGQPQQLILTTAFECFFPRPRFQAFLPPLTVHPRRLCDSCCCLQTIGRDDNPTSASTPERCYAQCRRRCSTERSLSLPVGPFTGATLLFKSSADPPDPGAAPTPLRPSLADGCLGRVTSQPVWDDSVRLLAGPWREPGRQEASRLSCRSRLPSLSLPLLPCQLATV